MDENEFRREYMCEFKHDPIYKAVKRAYAACDHDHRERNKGKNNLCPPSVSVLYHYVKCLESTSEKPEDTLEHVLIGLAKQMDEYYYKLVAKEMWTLKPISID